MTHTLIVGGGFSGLGAAYQAHAAGTPYTLVECADHLGGVVQSYRHDGFVAETGAHSLRVRSPELMRLLDALPLGTYTWLSSSCNRRFILRQGTLYPVPEGLGDFLTTPLWTLSAKIRLLLEPFLPRRCTLRDVSLGTYLEERLGRPWVDYAAGPLVRGIYGTDPYTLSLRYSFAPLYRAASRSHSLLLGLLAERLGKKLRGHANRPAREQPLCAAAERPPFKPCIVSGLHGMQSLVEGLVSALAKEQLHTGVHDLHLRYLAPHQWQAHWTYRGQLHTANFARCILTVPAYRLPALRVEAPPAWSQEVTPLAQLPYAPMGCMTLGVSLKHIARAREVQSGFGFLVPAVEPASILGTLFNGSMFPHRAPLGYTTLATFVGDPATVADPCKARQAVVGTLQALLGLDPAGIAFEHYTPWPQAIPQYTGQHGLYLQAADNLEAALPGLSLKANWRNGIALGDCF